MTLQQRKAFMALLGFWAKQGWAVIGFTGTRNGMTPGQVRSFTEVCGALRNAVPVWTLHHGDCLGADVEAHAIALDCGARIVLHPAAQSTTNDQRAYCIGAHETKPVWPALLRNRDIVNESQLLVAAPFTVQEQLRSGTWSTIRYCRNNFAGVKSILTLEPEPFSLRSK